MAVLLAYVAGPSTRASALRAAADVTGRVCRSCFPKGEIRLQVTKLKLHLAEPDKSEGSATGRPKVSYIGGAREGPQDKRTSNDIISSLNLAVSFKVGGVSIINTIGLKGATDEFVFQGIEGFLDKEFDALDVTGEQIASAINTVAMNLEESTGKKVHVNPDQFKKSLALRWDLTSTCTVSGETIPCARDNVETASRVDLDAAGSGALGSSFTGRCK
jgi:hypothetical protein